MQNNRIPRTIAIVGCGPRGLWALENLVLSLLEKSKLHQISILLFEMEDELGTSMVYNTRQVASNWMNLTERLIQIEERKALTIGKNSIPAFPSYQVWVNNQKLDRCDEKMDSFPPRSRIGRYLNERFLSLFKLLDMAGLVALYKTTVVDLGFKDGRWSIDCLDGKSYASDEVLLTIGHQNTVDDEQVKKWMRFQNDRTQIHLFKSPYPISQFYAHEPQIQNQHVAIRGFGLAMIDLVRGLANRIGQFEIVDTDSRQMKFESDRNVKLKLIPFSLDGLPMAPKPLNEKMDMQYAPRDGELEAFKEIISNDKFQSEAERPDFLINAFAKIALKVYSRYHSAYSELKDNELENIAKQWLDDANYNHRFILSKEQSTLDMMKAFSEMAIEKRPATLGYFFGQLWRHIQPTMYTGLSYNQCSDEVISQIVGLDERMKRYAYGPPVDSISQLIALAEAGVMNLTWVCDPNIELTDSGWELKHGDQTIVASMMVDSVLNQPVLSDVNSPLVLGLKQRNYIVSVNSDLGILTNKEGNVTDEKGELSLPLSVLGRLAKGTIIGVDALMEALGDRPKDWANAAANRHIDFLEKQKL